MTLICDEYMVRTVEISFFPSNNVHALSDFDLSKMAMGDLYQKECVCSISDEVGT
jgi:hypothetical protein